MVHGPFTRSDPFLSRSRFFITDWFVRYPITSYWPKCRYRVLGEKKGFSFHEWNNRINRMSYDFVVCSRDASVIAAIELDDQSHESESRAATDQKKNRATASAGVRLIRWHVKALPDLATIQNAFADDPLTAAPSALAVHELPSFSAGARIRGAPEVLKPQCPRGLAHTKPVRKAVQGRGGGLARSLPAIVCG
jgi:Protein of unknown function (DUF2726)